MTNDEAVGFLREYLDDYEKLHRLIQDGYRKKWDQAGSKAHADEVQAMTDSLSLRTEPANTLVSTAGISHVHFSPELAFDRASVLKLHHLLLRTIGVYEHGMVRIGEQAPQPPPAAESPPLGAPPIPETSRRTMRERFEEHPVIWIGTLMLGAAIAGAKVGYSIRDWVDAAATRHAKPSTEVRAAPAASQEPPTPGTPPASPKEGQGQRPGERAGPP